FYDINRESTLNEEELKNLPREVDLKDVMTSVKDQDDRGTCSFFTTAGLIESAIKKKMKVDVNVSEEYLNYVIKSSGTYADTDGSDSASNVDSLDKVKASLLMERDWPYQPSWFGVTKSCKKFVPDQKGTPLECYSHNAPPESVLVKKIPMDHFRFHTVVKTTNEIIKYMAEERLPISIGIPVNRNGWGDDGIVRYDEELRQECISQKLECGGHEVILTGYDLDKKVFYFRNSWSKEWGKSGYGTFPFNLVDKHSDFSSVAAVSLEENVEQFQNAASPLNEKDVVVKNYKISSKQDKLNSSITVDTAGELSNLNYYPVRIGVTLVNKVGDLSKVATDDNSNPVPVSPEDQKKYEVDSFLGEGKQLFPSEGIMSWNKGVNKLSLSATEMTIPAVKTLMSSQFNSVYLRSSVYLYTDEGVKVIKRIYHPFNFEN
ncbi:MAG: C1 family peptidase, partial [Bdellovibrionales bacterium]|nr:C1 family peptidase [Bdellovibrionales bacterium]